MTVEHALDNNTLTRAFALTWPVSESEASRSSFSVWHEQQSQCISTRVRVGSDRDRTLMNIPSFEHFQTRSAPTIRQKSGV